nr:hypothetical protein FYQYKPKK_FYQYKPKK_CDS_0010 [Microvirus sp.]
MIRRQTALFSNKGTSPVSLPVCLRVWEQLPS